VIDVRANKLVKAIPELPGITGLEYVPALRKVYTSDWGEEKIGVVDLRSMSVTKRLATAAKPNGSTYALPFHKVYVSNTLGKAVAIVDVDKDEITKTLEFKSETGMPQYDSVARKDCRAVKTTKQNLEATFVDLLKTLRPRNEVMSSFPKIAERVFAEQLGPTEG